jgi:hypothetical protein
MAQLLTPLYHTLLLVTVAKRFTTTKYEYTLLHDSSTTNPRTINLSHHTGPASSNYQMAKGSTETPTDYQNTPQCLHRALFLHSMPLLLNIFVVPVLAIIAIFLMAALRVRVIDEWQLGSAPPASTTTVPSSTVNPSVNVNDTEAVLPDITAPEPSEGQVEGEEPPPYQPSARDTIPAAPPIAPGILIPPTPALVPLTSESNAKSKPIALPSSAHRFVFGTSLFAANIFTLFTLALAIQAWFYCSETLYPVFWGILLWGAYGGVCISATISASCWIILCRDLGGKGMKKRWPLDEWWVLRGVQGAIIMAVAPPLKAIGKGAVRLVKFCQGWWCSGVLEEEDGMELVEEHESTGGAVTGEGSSTNEEERVGLMDGETKAL